MNEHFYTKSEIRDYDGEPLSVNIDQITKANRTYRTALWTGEHLQVTVMSIPVGGDIGLEIPHHTDQFIRIEYAIRPPHCINSHKKI